eukprot:Partr_v1_DN28233_c1_g1_i1_m75347 putative Elongation factor
MQNMDIDEIPRQNQIVLHEDKKYYPDADEVFGEDVEAIVQDEDTQLLTEPIIAPISHKTFTLQEKEIPSTFVSTEYLLQLTQQPEFIRNLAIVGHLHHGKTSFVDMLVQHTHEFTWDVGSKKEKNHERYLDISNLERARGISIKSQPITLALPNSKGKHHLFNIIDTPGHVDLIDEAVAGLRISDGAVLVVDAVDGVMLNTERLLKEIVLSQMPIVLVINKVDRLILELKMPPADAYYKLRHTVEEVNSIIAALSASTAGRLSPELGNVCFASTRYGFLFSLASFGRVYQDVWAAPLDIDSFAKRLWGDIYFDADGNKFIRKSDNASTPRSFVHFIMEPLYKIFSAVISQEPKELQAVLAKLGLKMKKVAETMDIIPLLKEVCSQFFGDFSAFVDAAAHHCPDPVTNAQKKVEQIYSGDLDSPLAIAMLECKADGPLAIHVVKMYPSDNRQRFNALGRIFSGTVRPGIDVHVLGEGFSPDDDEDMTEQVVGGICIYQSRYSINVQSLSAGNWVLIEGVDETIAKTGTIVDSKSYDEEVNIFLPLRFPVNPVIKIAVEPMNPSELPKMLEGLRKINKSYLSVYTKVEESGEHVIFAPGEIYADSVMHDLRKLFSEIEIRISDPAVRFCETVVETSSIKCFAETPNKKNKLTIIAEPLDEKLDRDIESGAISLDMPPKQVQKFFEEKYGWDMLASRGIWAFGPEDNSPNILLDDTLPGEVDKKLLATVKES